MRTIPIVNQDLQELVDMLTEIQGFYLSHATDESKLRIKAVEELNHQLTRDGANSFVTLGGSTSFGMATSETIKIGRVKPSDYDLIGIYDESKFSCRSFSEYVVKFIQEFTGAPVDVDWVAVGPTSRSSFLEQAHSTGERVTTMSLVKTYFSVSNLVDVTHIEDLLWEINYSQLTSLQDPSHSASMSWERNFDKYHKRLRASGVEVPKKQLDLESRYLDLCEKYHPSIGKTLGLNGMVFD